MRVWVAGGTTEGRILATLLSQRGIPVTVSVATALGQEELAGLSGVEVLVGRKNGPQLAQAIQGYDCCVDATHPYAVEISKELQWACQKVGVPLGRLLRPLDQWEGGITVNSSLEAAQYLEKTQGRILLAIGAKGLGDFVSLDPARLYPRVLPAQESLEACSQAGIPSRNILALYGPFSQELNEAILRQYQIQWLVTKHGGAAGGFPEKVAAAKAVGAKLVVIQPPRESGHTMEEIVSWLIQLDQGSN